MFIKHNCYICGFSLCIERHHIVPKSKGGTNDIANMIRLCPNCHTAVHRGAYSEEELFNLKEAKESKRGTSTPGHSIRSSLTTEERLFHSDLTLEQINLIVVHSKFSPGDKFL